MNTLTKPCLILAFTILAAGCTSRRDRMAEDIKNRIHHTNSTLLQQPGNSTVVDSLKQTIETYIAAYPDDSLAPGYLLQLGLMYQQQDPERAVAELSKVYQSYPDSREAHQALFAEAFIYAEVLEDYDMAKERYEFYLEKYSATDEKMTKDAQMQLLYLGKSDEEMLRDILRKNADTSASA